MRATNLRRVRAQWETTLALLKPDLLADAARVRAVEQEIGQQFRVQERRQIAWTRAQAEAFYAEHQGRPFFGRLVGYMTSGPFVALALAGPQAVSQWRKTMGGTRPVQMRVRNPASLRARFGLTDTRNSFHGSDSAETARRELAFLFGDSKIGRNWEHASPQAGNLPPSSRDTC
ncbi:hypothetical protein H4R21_006234 [Coemansia helicoidea]|uniref:Uncharacterized protein n=1 Tax=Coemansia helicoidea TaxID=1286919 RepID=A0ACC1KMJ5_9FUNG|nr:hypothetical protein H4R21_006234 [Coemansia helicoidea]